MKKIVLLAAAALVSTGAFAQSPLFVSGNAAFASEKYGDDKANAVVFRPQVGYMFNENFGAALDLDILHTKDGKDKASGFGAGVSGLYSLKITDKLFYAPSLRVGFRADKEEYEGEDAWKSTVIGVDLNALAFELRPSTHWAFTLGFGGASFQSDKYKDDDDAKTNFNLGLTKTTAGFKYYF